MTDDSDERALHVVRGDWVESRLRSIPVVGRVRESRWVREGAGFACKIDVVLYDYSGGKIGRESPAMRGPRGYEPFLDYSDWLRIRKPEFPLVGLSWVEEERDGKKMRIARHVTGCSPKADRTEVVKVKPKGLVPPPPPRTDFNPELEVRSRRMSAQELRDVYRSTRLQELADRADRLEKEASEIAREHGLER